MIQDNKSLIPMRNIRERIEPDSFRSYDVLDVSEFHPEFTLYGGTAIALRLGHRFSVDFDFFSPTPFVPAALMKSIPYLADGSLRQSATNMLTLTIERGAPVQLSFFGGLRIGQVAPTETVEGPGFNPLIALKAISYHDDPSLAGLSGAMRRDLIAAVRGVDVGHLPRLDAVRARSECP